MRSLSRKAQLLSSSAPQLISPSVLSFTILQAFSTPSSAFQLASRAPPPVTLQHLCSSRPEWLNGSPPMCLSVPRLLRISAPRAHMFSMSASAPEGDDPWYSAGLRFSCSLCGNCCSGFQIPLAFQPLGNSSFCPFRHPCLGFPVAGLPLLLYIIPMVSQEEGFRVFHGSRGAGNGRSAQTLE